MAGSLPNDSNGINKLDGNPLKENEAFFKRKKGWNWDKKAAAWKKEKWGVLSLFVG